MIITNSRISKIFIIISLLLIIGGFYYDELHPNAFSENERIKVLKEDTKARFDDLAKSIKKNKKYLKNQGIYLDSLLVLIEKKEIYIDSLISSLGKLKTNNSEVIQEIYKALSWEAEVTSKYLKITSELAKSKNMYEDSELVNNKIVEDNKQLEATKSIVDDSLNSKNELPYYFKKIYLSKLTKKYKNTNYCSDTHFIQAYIELSECTQDECYISVIGIKKSNPESFVLLGKIPEYSIPINGKSVTHNIPIKYADILDLKDLVFYFEDKPKIPRKVGPCNNICN